MSASLRAVLVLVLASAGLGWWLAPVAVEEARLVQERRDSWQLPVPPRRPDGVTATALLNEAAFWGAAAELAAATTVAEFADPRWRVAAVYGRGGERGVLVTFMAPGKPALRLRVGEALPSGHRIEEIRDRDFCIRIENKLYRLGVERSDS